MDGGGLAPELGYLGVPSLGVYAYTHWEWGQFLGALKRPLWPAFHSCAMSELLHGGPGGLPVQAAEGGFLLHQVLCFPLSSEQRGGFPWSPASHLLPPPPLPSDGARSVTPWDFSSSGCCPSELRGQMHVGSGVVFV